MNIGHYTTNGYGDRQGMGGGVIGKGVRWSSVLLWVNEYFGGGGEICVDRKLLAREIFLLTFKIIQKTLQWFIFLGQKHFWG
jgi:hypothetical protein